MNQSSMNGLNPDKYQQSPTEEFVNGASNSKPNASTPNTAKPAATKPMPDSVPPQTQPSHTEVESRAQQRELDARQDAQREKIAQSFDAEAADYEDWKDFDHRTGDRLPDRKAITPDDTDAEVAEKSAFNAGVAQQRDANQQKINDARRNAHLVHQGVPLKKDGRTPVEQSLLFVR